MHAPRPVVVAPHGVRLAELALAVGGLAIGTGEFASMGLLPYVASTDHVSIPTMGHMISAYALGVVVGAPVITVLMAKAPRRVMLIVLMSLFALGNLLSAVAPGYDMTVAARFIAGVPHGAFFGLASLVAASLVPPDKRAQAVGRVMLGLSVANVIGVPLATGLGQTVGWRWAFVLVGALGALTAIMVRLFIPVIPVAEGAGARRELSAFGRPQVWLTLAVGSIGFGGMFAVYSYITPTLIHVTGLPAAATPLMLSVIGLGMIAGAVVGGALADKALTATIFGILIMSAVVQAAFVPAAHNVWTVTLDLFLVGGGLALAPALQTRLMDVAGEAQTLAAALNNSAFNIANAMGAWLGGLSIAAGLGWASTGAVGCGLALGGVVLMVVTVAVERGSARRRVEAAAQGV